MDFIIEKGGLITMRNRNMAVITGVTLGLAVSLLFAGFARAFPPKKDYYG
jgi:hypothetical protein